MFERFARDARAAVVLAEQEARELGDRTVGPEHLLVGVLQSAGRELAAACIGYGLTVEAVRERLLGTGRSDTLFDEDAEALKSLGIDLKAMRDNVTRTFGPDTFGDALRRSGRRRRRRGQISLDKAAKKALELALRETVAHRDSAIECEHLLLGIVGGGDRHTLGLITEYVEAATLRAAVNELLNRAA